jgi:AraC family transcriptional regulator of adaptative response / DNA-3-methyladenine glycosylase II
VRLLATRPFHADGVLAFLATRSVPGLDEVAGRTYRRPGVRLDVDEGGADLACADSDAERRARRLLDLDADPAAVAAVLGADSVLAPLVEAGPGRRVPGAWDGFELAVRAVVGQQVTVAAGRTLLERVVQRCGSVLVPEVLAAADLDGLGMPGARVATLRALAAAILAGDASLDEPASLLAIRGIGPWTVAYVAMRMGDGDAFPVGDVAVRTAAARLGLPSGDRDLLAHAERWRPYRAYATVHLWASTSTGG